MLNRYKTFGLIPLLCTALLFGVSCTSADKSAGEYVDDAVVTTKVKTALIQAGDVDAIDIDVDTHKGVVELSGTVDSESEASQAAQIAGTVDGIKRVESELKVE